MSPLANAGGAHASHACNRRQRSSVQLLVVFRNLECLEATFYSYAAYGSGLNSSLRGDGPTAIGGKRAMLSSPVQNYANEVARDEINHVSITS